MLKDNPCLLCPELDCILNGCQRKRDALARAEQAEARLAEVEAELSEYGPKCGCEFFEGNDPRYLTEGPEISMCSYHSEMKAVVEAMVEITGGWEEAYIKDELAAVAIPADKALALLAAVTALTEGDG